MPADFVKDKPKLTETELKQRVRLQGWRMFCKDPTLPEDATPPPGFSFEECCQNLRDALVAFAKSRILELAVIQFLGYEPGYTFAGRQIGSYEDLLQSFISEPWGREQRRRAFYTQIGMWGPSNQVILRVALAAMRFFKIKFSNLLCSGEKRKKNHQGGSVRVCMSESRALSS